ncbi:GPI anchored protein [Rutstroemia sp. NJR-2017a WRK4]|nr:GPI anchored protein [Rutstroemia sp. NJR-2017a WRK4]
MLFHLERSLASLVFCVEVVAALYSNEVDIFRRDLASKRQTTSLSAITIRSSEQKRALANFKPNYECEHHYADHDSILRGMESRFATTSMRYKLPAVALEDIELNVKNIVCSDSAIIINFPSASLLAKAEREWGGLAEFLVISSHAGCNDDGARAPYLVSSVLFNSGSNDAVLSVRRISWRDAYGTMEVKFGMGQYERDSLRTHRNVEKRTLTSTTVASSETVSFPSAPSVTPTSETSTHDIGHVASSDFAIPVTHSNGNTEETMSIRCSNCSMAGTISITHGTVTVSHNVTRVNKAIHFLRDGYFNAEVNGLNAHIELDTTITGALSAEFSQPLVIITLPGFTIPEIASIGPMWIPTITGEISVSSSMDFTYGFEFKVPDKSFVMMNISNISESSSNGFSQASINTIPFTSTTPLNTLTFTLGLQSQLLLGVDILEGSGSINAGAFINLPELSVAFSKMSDVDANCVPINKTSSDSKVESFQNLVNIVPAAQIAIGLQAGIQAEIADYTEAVGMTATIGQTGVTLPTACLSFDGSKKAFASATTTSTSTSTSTSSSGGGKSKSAGVNRGPPSGSDAIFWTGGMLLSVLFVALAL